MWAPCLDLEIIKNSTPKAFPFDNHRMLNRNAFVS